MRLGILAAFVAIASLGDGAAQAEECPVPKGADPRLAAMDARERLDLLHRTLDQQASYATLWTWGWAGVGTAIAWANFILADRASSLDDREDHLIVGAFTLLIPISKLVMRLRVATDAPRLDALVLAGGEQTCLVLARAEQFMARDAADEDFDSGILAHLAGVVASGALFAILASMEHWTNAIFNGVGGVALSEVMILTQPTGASRVWDHYRKADLPRVTLSPLDAPRAAGVSLRVAF